MLANVPQARGLLTGFSICCPIRMQITNLLDVFIARTDAKDSIAVLCFAVADTSEHTDGGIPKCKLFAPIGVIIS